MVLGLGFGQCRIMAQPSQDRDPTHHLSLIPLLNWTSHQSSKNEPGEDIKQATSLAYGYQAHLWAVTV